MRPLLALLLASLLVPLALPTAAATVRTCNAANSPVWVDGVVFLLTFCLPVRVA